MQDLHTTPPGLTLSQSARKGDRPTYHLMPQRGWLNDPNGLILYKGRYHVFYQHVEEGCEWEWCLVWGHAVSTDLVHWQRLPPALRPTPGSPDADGCWSGCCALGGGGGALGAGGLPVLLYTGVRLRSNPGCGPLPPPECDLGLDWIETQCAAVPEDPDDELLVRWRMVPPILPLPPPGLMLTGWRDPFVLEPGASPGGGYTMLLGSGFEGRGGALLVYRSQQLLHGWEYAGALCTGRGALAHAWVSPYPAASPHKPSNPALYWTGALAQAADGSGSPCFPLAQAQGPFRLDLGDILYAPTVCKDNKGRWLLWGWVQERRKAGSYTYSGCLTLPRLLTLAGGGRVHQAPAPEMSLLRADSCWRAERLAVDPCQPLPLGGPPSQALDIELTLQRGSASSAGLFFKCYSAEGDGDAALLYDWHSRRLELRFDVAHLLPATTDGAADVMEVLGELASPRSLAHGPGGPAGGPGAAAATSEGLARSGHGPVSVGGQLEPGPSGSSLRLRILLDHSCLEVFRGEGQALTSRLSRGALPQGAAGSGVSLVAVGGCAEVLDVKSWVMGSCWRSVA